ncbi:MAG: TetR/AcrR family transcriptional regulator [Actinomycetota bacterium]
MATSKPTKRKQQRIETRQRIFDTAMGLFTRKGYTKVSVNDICEKAGVSKGTFYYHFKSKSQVLSEHFLKIDDFYTVLIEQLNKEEKSPTRRLVTFTTKSFSYVNDLGVKITKIIWHSQINPLEKKPDMANPRRPVYGILEQLIREGQEQGELRRDVSAETMADLYVRCYRGIIYEWCLHNGKFDIIEACEDFTKLVIEGFKKQ